MLTASTRWGPRRRRPFPRRPGRATVTHPAAAAHPMPAYLRALDSRNYRIYFAGQIVSLAGTWMQQIAMV